MRPSLTDRVGDGASVLLGGAAFAASAIHVYSVCRNNGAELPVAVLITTAFELLALVSILELRRGFRWTPLVGLGFGIALTLAANLATAKQNGPGWGWPETVAVAPAVLFLVVLAIVETRPKQPAAGADAVSMSGLDDLRRELDAVRRSIPAAVVPEVGRGDLDGVRDELDERLSKVLDEMQSKLDALPSPTVQSNRPARQSKPQSKPESNRSADYTEAVRLLRASGVQRSTAYNRADRAETDGTLPALIAELRTPRAVGS